MLCLHPRPYVLIFCGRPRMHVSCLLATAMPVQIHLFLAMALEFFERSGLNVTGGINHDNVTEFEVREERG